MAARSIVRIAVNVALDGGLAALSVPFAHWIAAPTADPFTPSWTIPAGAAVLLLAGAPLRLSLQYWRFAGLSDLLAVAGAAVLGAALFATVLTLTGTALPSPAFPVVHALTLLALLGTPRVLYRQHQLRRPRAGADSRDATALLLVGAVEDLDLLLRALAQDRRQSFQVAGLLAIGSGQRGRRIQGHTILGGIDDMPAVLDRLAAEDRLPANIVIASADLGGAALSRLIDQADRFGLSLRRVPRPTALGPAGPSRRLELRPVVIDDLLNRAQVPLDREGMARLIQGRRVIVTGAGGTIGSELARQVAAFGPEMLILLDNGEYALWQIDTELTETHPQVHRQALIADIRDEARVRAVFDNWRPELVFHAAALKHVPIVESNPLEGLLTNVAGTRHVADAARAIGAQAMVLISTDKAVNPTSVMGASKRLAEMYCQALDIEARARSRDEARARSRDEAHAHSRDEARAHSRDSPRAAGLGMRCITVRFGNVLGSTGSVVPLFQRQLERGGPLTVTHPDMQRYFMTVREAVGLVLQASVIGVGEAELPVANQGGIFVLDMGPPVKIVDLARQMIRLVGLKPDEDVEIRFTGLRPGEKLHEELFHGQEPPVPTGHAGLLMAAPRTADPAIVGRAIEEIAAACRGGQPRLALTLLGRLVPEFDHNADGAAEPARAVTSPAG